MAHIRFTSVTKSYPLNPGKQWVQTLLADRLTGRNGRFTALQDISFEMKEGDSYAVIGPNGAGKSTLLAVIAGLYSVDQGKIEVEGRISTLLDLGSGFHPELTGRENVIISGALMGYSNAEILQRLPSIVEFSEMGEFMDRPIRTYSSGMAMRLAFAVAVQCEPEILLIDEVLAVGDQSFQQKCVKRIHKLKAAGKIMVCVSHNPASLVELCDKAIWIEKGRMVRSGPLKQLLAEYEGHRGELPTLAASAG